MNLAPFLSAALIFAAPPQVDDGWITVFRADLKLADAALIELVKHRRSKWTETAIALILHKGRYRLMSVWRRPNDRKPNFRVWQIDEISVYYEKGDRWIVFDKEYDHRPTQKEIKQFTDWLRAWDVRYSN
jgi:hypothetical protein